MRLEYTLNETTVHLTHTQIKLANSAACMYSQQLGWSQRTWRKPLQPWGEHEQHDQDRLIGDPGAAVPLCCPVTKRNTRISISQCYTDKWIMFNSVKTQTHLVNHSHTSHCCKGKSIMSTCTMMRDGKWDTCFWIIIIIIFRWHLIKSL